MEDNNSFLVQQQQAIKRMQEMNKKATLNSTHKMPPAPPFVKTAFNQNNPAQKATKEEPVEKQADTLDNIVNSLNIPFLNTLKTDSDLSLILGIILILLSEKSDRLLLLALVYILL